MFVGNIDSSYHTLMRHKFAGVLQLSVESVISLISQQTPTLLAFQSNCAQQFLTRSCNSPLGFSVLHKRDLTVFNCWFAKHSKRALFSTFSRLSAVQHYLLQLCVSNLANTCCIMSSDYYLSLLFTWRNSHSCPYCFAFWFNAALSVSGFDRLNLTMIIST